MNNENERSSRIHIMNNAKTMNNNNKTMNNMLRAFGIVFQTILLLSFFSCSNSNAGIKQTEQSGNESMKKSIAIGEELLETAILMQGSDNVFSNEDSFTMTSIPTNQYISRIAVSPDKTLLAYGDDSKDIFNEEGTFNVTVLTTSDYKQKYSFSDNLSSIQAIDFNRLSSNILFSDCRNVVIHELKNGKTVTSFKAPNYVLDVKYASDDKIVVLCGLDKVAYIYSTEGELLNTISAGSQINAMTINPVKNELILAGHYDIQLWSLDDYELLKKLPTIQLNAATINPSHTQIAFGTLDGTIHLYTTDLEKIAELEGHFMPVLDLDYSANGGMLISGSSDQSFRIWNTKTKEVIKEVFNEHRSMVQAVRFINISNDFVTGGNSNELKIWRKEKSEE